MEKGDRSAKFLLLCFRFALTSRRAVRRPQPPRLHHRPTLGLTSADRHPGVDSLPPPDPRALDQTLNPPPTANHNVVSCPQTHPVATPRPLHTPTFRVHSTIGELRCSYTPTTPGESGGRRKDILLLCKCQLLSQRHLFVHVSTAVAAKF